MSLYNRDNRAQNEWRGGDFGGANGAGDFGANANGASRWGARGMAQASQDEQVAFIKRVYQLLTASLVAGTIGAYVGTEVVQTFSIGLVILELACLFGLYFAKNKPTLALALLFAFTFISGLTLGPVLNRYIGAGMGNLITQAFLMTAVAFGGLTVFAFNTKRDFTAMGKMLFIVLIVLVVAGISNFFFQSSLLSVALSGVAAVLFSAYILYDTQMIIRGGYDSAVLAAVALYLDVLNLFVSLLNLLGFANRE